MSRRSDAIASALITLIVFTVLPLMTPRFVPSQYLEMVSQVGIEINQFTNQIAMIGGIVAILTLVKGFSVRSSPIYLIAALASSGVTFAFTVMTLSLGKLEELRNLGLTSITVDVQGSLNEIVLDFRIFVQLTALAVALKMVEAVLEFMEARKNAQRTSEVPVLKTA
ncbi:MAG: hypothetical protein PVH79_00700 [Candidatus Bathyarchaeota archaeon]|jgi:hypothetical protein